MQPICRVGLPVATDVTRTKPAQASYSAGRQRMSEARTCDPQDFVRREIRQYSVILRECQWLALHEGERRGGLRIFANRTQRWCIPETWDKINDNPSGRGRGAIVGAIGCKAPRQG